MLIKAIKDNLIVIRRAKEVLPDLSTWIKVPNPLKLELHLAYVAHQLSGALETHGKLLHEIKSTDDDSKGMTALHHAVSKACYDVMEVLLVAAGTNRKLLLFSAEDSNGEDALSFAYERGENSKIDAKSVGLMLKYAHEYAGELIVRNIFEGSLEGNYLHEAVFLGNTAVVSIMLHYAKDKLKELFFKKTNKSDFFNETGEETVLHIAIRNRNVPMCDLLKSFAGDWLEELMKIENGEGKTPSLLLTDLPNKNDFFQ